MKMSRCSGDEVDRVNAAGGINGSMLKIISYDSQSIPAEGEAVTKPPDRRGQMRGHRRPLRLELGHPHGHDRRQLPRADHRHPPPT